MIRAGVRRAFRLVLRRRDRWEHEVEDEIKLHLSLRTEQLVAQGATPDDAFREAARRFGPLTESRARLLHAARHREQRMHRTEYIADVRQDISFAWRTLSRQKGWTAVTILTLALGVGATTAVFSVVSSLLLHPIPYPDADRVVIVEQQPNQGNNTGIRVSITPASPIVNAWRAGSHVFETLEPYRARGMLLHTTGDPTPVRVTSILPSFLTFADERPLIGRIFSADEIQNKAPVALLSEGIWRERFGADDKVLGRSITIGGPIGDSAYTIIGVLPASLQTPGVGRDRTDIWFPLDLKNRNLGLSVVARLRPQATISAATRELDALALRADIYPPGKVPFVTVVRRPAELIEFRDSLIMLTAAVALVLLVACANVAHLMMVRTATRQRELAVRVALGAGRARLFRQLITESLMLAFAGAAGGVLLGWLGLRAMLALHPASMAELTVAHLDLTTLGVTIVASVLSGILFGVIGAFESSKQSTHEALKAGSLATSHTRGRDRLRSLLVVSEMALSATLIVGATLLIRTVVNLQRTDLGFEPKGLYAVNVSLPNARYRTPASRAAFFNEIAARLRATRGVRGLAFSAVPPGARSFSVGTFEIDGETAANAAGSSFTDVNDVDNDFFKTMGIRIIEGTLFTDTTDAAGQVIVNAAFAHAHWLPGRALGHRVRVAHQGSGRWQTIVGVAADASTTGPGALSTAPLLYGPKSDHSLQESIMVRTEGATDLAGVVRAIVKTIDPQLSPPHVESTEAIVSRTISGPRFTMLLLSAFTFLALVLAAVGLYGVMAYSVTQQTREIGIRIALGATQRAIAKAVVLRGVLLALMGAGMGLAGAFWGSRLIAKMLYGVAPLDPISFAAGALLLIFTAIAACVVPTRRALAIDPIRAIRAD
jgi:putative ABC transport system permease protein